MLSKLRLVSLYTGAGGLDYGFEAAGFQAAVGVEFDADCKKTVSTNRPWPIIDEDICSVSTQTILAAGGLRAEDVDILIGGPPCQPFSKAAYWASGDTKRLDDPRARTLYEYMRCVEDILPEVFLLENVHGISYSGKEEGFLLLKTLTDEINAKQGTRYTLSWRVLNAADYGVPQMRTRFFLIGHRDGKSFEFPRPTHRTENTPDIGDSRLPHVTAWDAIGRMGGSYPGEDLRVRGEWGGLLPSIPEGENYLWHTNRKGGLPLFGWRTRYWSFLLKLTKSRPSWTIQAQPGPAIGPFHWENRMLSVNELAALQTFPKDLVFKGSRQSIQRQIGNAVPSLLAEVLARAIAEQFFGVQRPPACTLAVPLDRPIPPPEPIQPVPDKYLSLIGDHPDHPGERRKGRMSATGLLSAD